MTRHNQPGRAAFALFLCFLNLLLANPSRAADLVWEYPPHLLSTGLTFHVVWAGSVATPLTNWVPYATLVGTNTSLRISGQTTNHFFGVIASNVHGSFFCDAPCLNPALVLPTARLRLTNDGP